MIIGAFAVMVWSADVLGDDIAAAMSGMVCDLRRGVAARRCGWPVLVGDIWPGDRVPAAVIKVNAGVYIYDKK